MMTNLLRFDFNDRDGIFEVVENGDWVRATDYNAVAVKLAEVEEDRDDLQIALASARKQLERYIGEAKAADLATPLDDPRVKALVKKARAVVDRWDSPLWKDLPHTGESIADLRAALSALEENK